MNAQVQFREGQMLTVEDFQRWELQEDGVYRFWKNGKKSSPPFLEIPRERINFILDQEHSGNGLEPDPQKQINQAGTPQPIRQAAMEQGKHEAGRYAAQRHKTFLEITDQTHETKPLRLHKPTEDKIKTLEKLVFLANLGAQPQVEEKNVVLTLKFRDLEKTPRFVMPREGFEKMTAQKKVQPVTVPLVRFQDEMFRAAVDGDKIELWRCGVESHGKVRLEVTEIPLEEAGRQHA